MRLDRFITLFLARTWCSLSRGSQDSHPPASRLTLPVLMYHSISHRDERHLRDYFKVCTPPDRFRQQMQTLRDNGYIGVDLETGLAWLNDNGAPVSDPARMGRELPPMEETTLHANRDPESGRALTATGSSSQQIESLGRGEVSASHSALRIPRSAFMPLRPVAITFDDGFRDFFTEALPVMEAMGYGATMYLPTSFIGDEREIFKGLECMTWSEVREARNRGIRFGSHTCTHPRLYDLPWPAIEAELRDSRMELESQQGAPAESFAYPYAFPEADREFCGRLCDTLMASGYKSCATTIIGRVTKGDGPYALRRLPINGADDAAFLRAKLEGAYDWLSVPQAIVKRLKHRRPSHRPAVLRPLSSDI